MSGCGDVDVWGRGDVGVRGGGRRGVRTSVEAIEQPYKKLMECEANVRDLLRLENTRNRFAPLKMRPAEPNIGSVKVLAQTRSRKTKDERIPTFEQRTRRPETRGREGLGAELAPSPVGHISQNPARVHAPRISQCR